MPERVDDLRVSRQQKLERLKQRDVNPYPPRYHRSHTNAEALELFRQQVAGAPEGSRTSAVSLAGRILSIRGMGKASFLDLRDGTTRIQVHLRRDLLGTEYDLVRDLDLGDFLGVEGPLFRTQRGEVTVEASHITLLSKAMRPLPEKWHGLRDVEQRYRQRYLDLVANPEVKAVFLKRGQIVGCIRVFLNHRGFVEVDTPILVPVAAGALARPFTTRHHTLDQTLYLRIATELYLKRLIVGGFDKVYELGRVFRNEGVDQDHNPEFTLLETYEAYADYNDVMAMVEEMVSSIAAQVLGATQIQYGAHLIDLRPPWRRVTFCEAVYERTGIDLAPYIHEKKSTQQLIDEARGRGLEIAAGPAFRVYDKLISLAVEPHFIQPTFLLDYPAAMSPLAKQKPEDPALVERFEGFAAGMEIANSFTELNDPQEQRKRFQGQEFSRQQFGDEEADRTDEDFLEALEYGMPPTGGLGMGIDRLVMLLTGQTTIRDVLLFPQMRSQREGSAS